MTIQRNLHSEPFSEEEIGRITAYRDLLTNSATIAKQLGFARIEGASSALEQQGPCTIALDVGERVVHVSPSAEPHLHDGLQVSGGRLHARLVTDAPALARLIHGICGKDTAASQRYVSLSRSFGKPPLVLYGCTLPDAQCDVFQLAVGLLVISDPQRPRDIPPFLLLDYFGLTPAEAGLAVALLHGASIEQYAADHRISPVTARNL